MNLEALRKRLAAIKTEAKAILDSADAQKNGKLAAEQAKAFDALMAEKDDIEANIKRLEALEAMDAGGGRVTDPGQPANPEAKKTRIEMGAERIEQDPMRGFKSAAEFGRAVHAACVPGGAVDPKLLVLRREDKATEVQAAATNFHRETSSADGYMVPPAMREEIWNLVFTDAGLLEAVMPEPTESNAVELLRDESTPWGATGIQAKWASEGGVLAASRLKTEKSLVQLHKLYAFVTATEELIEDAARLANRLTVGAAQAIRWKAEEALIDGDGVGKPLGYMKSAALVSVAKETGQVADTVVAANVAKMFSRLLMAMAVNPFWVIHQSVLPQLMLMTIGDQPIWTPPSTGFQGAPGGFLLGRPVRFSEHAEVVGDKGDIQLVAPNGYYATTKAGGVKFASSIHLYFDQGIEAFRWTFRLGGQPYLSAPVTPAKGSLTLSHFVTLDARA